MELRQYAAGRLLRPSHDLEGIPVSKKCGMRSISYFYFLLEFFGRIVMLGAPITLIFNDYRYPFLLNLLV